jgi:magnesium-transporting ATPase (P-type)
MAPPPQRHISPFKKRILIPFWLVQTALVALITAIYSFQLYASNFGAYVHPFSPPLPRSLTNPSKPLILVTIYLLALILIIVEIILHLCRSLKPIIYLPIQCGKTAIWAGMLLYVTIHTISLQDRRGGYGDPRTSVVGLHVGVMYVYPFHSRSVPAVDEAVGVRGARRY